MGKQRKTFKETLQDDEARGRVREITKLQRKTPNSAEWVVAEILVDARMRHMTADKWEVTDFPSKGVQQDWVKKYTMRKLRAALVADRALLGSPTVNEV